MAWYDCVVTKRQGIVLSVRKLRMSHCLANQHLAEEQQYTIPDSISVLIGTEPSENLMKKKLVVSESVMR